MSARGGATQQHAGANVDSSSTSNLAVVVYAESRLTLLGFDSDVIKPGEERLKSAGSAGRLVEQQDQARKHAVTATARESVVNSYNVVTASRKIRFLIGK